MKMHSFFLFILIIYKKIIENMLNSNKIEINEDGFQKIIDRAIKEVINETIQGEGISDIFINKRRNNDDEYILNKGALYHLMQALMFLDHGNSFMVRNEIMNAIKIINGSKNVRKSMNR